MAKGNRAADRASIVHTSSFCSYLYTRGPALPRPSLSYHDDVEGERRKRRGQCHLSYVHPLQRHQGLGVLFCVVKAGGATRESVAPVKTKILSPSPNFEGGCLVKLHSFFFNLLQAMFAFLLCSGNIRVVFWDTLAGRKCTHSHWHAGPASERLHIFTCVARGR